MVARLIPGSDQDLDQLATVTAERDQLRRKVQQLEVTIAGLKVELQDLDEDRRDAVSEAACARSVLDALTGDSK